MSHIYAKGIFEQPDDAGARGIILTPENNVDTETRWQRETPDTVDILFRVTGLSKGAVILDYGCGIGRLAKEILSRVDVSVIGVDISAQMRAKAVAYVDHPRFSVLSPEAFNALVYTNSLHVDLAYSVYTLQHVFEPAGVIAAIARAARYGLFVINANRRAVPVTEAATQRFSWVDDGIDIRALCLAHFPLAIDNVLDKNIYPLHLQQFCTLFSRDV